jgi:hypothetical protein
MQFGDRLLSAGRTAALCPHLDAAFVLLSCGDHPFAFQRIVAARLFHVHMFTRFAGHDRCRCVPMIGCCTHHGIDRRIVKDTPKILNTF